MSEDFIAANTVAGTSDLAGQMVGALVATAMVHKGSDMPYYRKLMVKAVELYAAAVKHKGRYSSKDIYKCAPQVLPCPGACMHAPATASAACCPHARFLTQQGEGFKPIRGPDTIAQDQVLGVLARTLTS